MCRLLYNSLIIHAILGLNEEEARKAEERDLCSTNASTDTKAIMDDPAPYTLKQRWVLQFLELGGLGAIWALFQKVRENAWHLRYLWDILMISFYFRSISILPATDVLAKMYLQLPAV